MTLQQSNRARIETVLAVATGFLAIVTLFWRDWIEAVFRVDPDHGNGDVEWLVVAALAVGCLTFSLLAIRDRRGQLRVRALPLRRRL